MNVAFSFFRNIAIAVYGKKDPTDEEINIALNEFKKVDPEKVCSLIVSDGGAPNAVQRKRLFESLGGKSHKSAMLTDSIAVRGAVVAISWFNPGLKAFPKASVDDALIYLGVSHDHYEAIREEVRRLQRMIK